MDEWEKITTDILFYISNIKTKTEKEKLIKMSLLINLYRMFYSEEEFNKSIDILKRGDEIKR